VREYVENLGDLGTWEISIARESRLIERMSRRGERSCSGRTAGARLGDVREVATGQTR